MTDTIDQRRRPRGAPRRDAATPASSRYRSSCASRASPRCPSTPPDCRRAARVARADALTRGRPRARRGRRDRRPSGRLRRLAPRRGRPDGPRLRPLRRPAGRPARAVDIAAVRAGRRRTAGSSAAARPTTRASSTLHVMAAAAAARDARRASRSTSSIVFEGEEESSSVNLDRLAGGQPGAPRRRRRDHQRHGLLRGQHPGDHGRPARHDVRPDRRRRAAPSTCTPGGFGGAVQNPANALAQIIAALKGPDGRIRDARASTTTSSPLDRRRARRRSRRCRSTRRPTGATIGVAGPRRRGRLHDPRAARRPGPTLDVNGIWGGFQGEGAKTIIPAHAHAKVSCRLVAAQDPTRIFEQFRAFVEEIAPPGRDGRRSRTSAAAARA